MQRQNTEKVRRGEIYLHDFGDNTGSIQNVFSKVINLKNTMLYAKCFWYYT